MVKGKVKFKNLSQERLKSLLSYEETTGAFTWISKSSKHSPVTVGERADKLHKSSGYRRVQIDGERYVAHRLAWLYVYGEIPEDEIDHINNDKTDNSIANLRLADGKNSLNAKLQSGTLTGVKGVTIEDGRFLARVAYKGTTYRVGRFLSLSDAEKAVREKREELHGEFTNHG